MDKVAAKQKALLAIMESTKEFLSPADIAPILDVDPHSIRLTARESPHLLKFEFITSGNRTKIPRIPFLRYIGVNVNEPKAPEEPQPKSNPYDKKPMTNEELLLAITLQINEFKKEINERLDDIEGQTKDLNNVLQSARTFINALSGIVDK